MLNLNLKSKFKKIIPASMAFAALLTVAPLSSFAAETDAPVKNNVVNFPQTNYNVTDLNQNPVVDLDEDGDVSAQGWKKSAVVWGLKNGGDALQTLTKWLGAGTKEAKYLNKHAKSIANALDRFESHIEQNLIDFMIFECGIPGGSARVIASAITGLVL
ncbi:MULTISPECIES: hypothetical protein [Bacillus]|uniref:Secreted protein n=2 Tax=Bacteria TaxID=2 RepID=A0AAN0SXY6_BACCE|nr:MULTISPECIES: hypothetical protein [Bacillus cereus group]ABK87574.1 hypothetical protein BALH_4375 [Bacillus thuringiensis str. Al Hakam]AJG61050.1 hypothetical protein AW22_5438 [Bacillus cereus D17]AJH70960.1 hypothetical protein BF32_2421 [Bacillus thuringiensis]AJI11749.1 hypothetical protein AK40_3430 [Bacillus cereus 03BB108]EDX63848.1 conserved hypothetical protein [Bacillus cereus 03BB108]